MPQRQFPLPRNQRLEAELYQAEGQVVFFTLRAFGLAHPFADPALADMVVAALHEEQARTGCRVRIYCLMPDHLHYLIEPGEPGLSVLTFTNQVKGRTTHQSWPLGWAGKLWQPRSYDHVVRKDEDLERIGLYILHNPVRRGLVDQAESWPWSGGVDCPWSL